ncbi:MAG: hypothetical protein JO270_16975, partial [Acidobacteriaceae bacterium]|nr:hypothetical protein [Acidobacteriaceae bacterium]
YQFETQFHAERRSGELLPERIDEIWLDIQKKSLGPAFDLTFEYGAYWAYIPHFVHSPFYVYAYAFGECLVCTLYALYESGHPNFESKYIEMLHRGGTKRHRELLAPFGVDTGDPAFWRGGLDLIASWIDELENISDA